MIEFRDVHASYDGSAPILKGVSFTIPSCTWATRIESGSSAKTGRGSPPRCA